MRLPKLEKINIAIIGLGYVGLPLAIEFGKKRPVIGYDTSTSRIEELKTNFDRNQEIKNAEFSLSTHLHFTNNPEEIADSNVYIVTVPTPITTDKRPDLTLLLKASETVGSFLKRGDIVVYESTVYPGATEEECIPILENISGLKYNQDFYAGYSPERINPGDKNHTLDTICKITSGSTTEVAELVDLLYGQIITAGTYKAESIRIAEAAKVIENTQRDLNIALINELAIIFNKMDIDTEAVLRAAGTKWNFLNFRPGIVGGHCIGVDPYYLTYKAEAMGYHPEIILAGRRLNDSMGVYVAKQMVDAMEKKNIQIDNSRLLIMGLTFKENCHDIRNTRVVDIIKELTNYKIQVDIYDPWVYAEEAQSDYGINILEAPKKNTYDGIIAAVNHDEFKKAGASWFRTFGRSVHVLYDLKHMFGPEASDIRL